MNWVTLSIISGLCAALNGLFAKLVTNGLTTGVAGRVAGWFGVGEGSWVVEGGVRGLFFVLNLVFNAIMWGMFTAALTRGSSATKVSVINTSSNFMLTALLGSLVFSERLPPLWFLGATLLIGGSVIIGRRDGDSDKQKQPGATAATAEGYVPLNQDENDGDEAGDGDEEGELDTLNDFEDGDGDRGRERERESDQGRRDFGSDTEGSRAGFSGRETPGTTTGDEEEGEGGESSGSEEGAER